MIDDFTIYSCVKSLKHKKAKAVLDGFIEIVNEIKYKPSKLCVGEGMEFYNSFLQKWLNGNGFFSVLYI